MSVELKTTSREFIRNVTTIEINPTELCNLRCTFCPRSTFYPNQNLHMSLDTAEEIYKQLMDIRYTGYVSITGRGEPTLHPQFDKLSEIFLRPERSWKVKCATNGKRLKKWFSTIEKYDLITYSLYEETYSQAQKIIKKYKGHRVIDVKYRPDTDENGNIIPWMEKGNFTNRAGSLEGTRGYIDKRCDVAFVKLFIDYDGIYRLCCEDWKEKIALGTIFEEHIGDYIETNEKLKSIQKQLIYGHRPYAPCKDCSYSPSQNKYNSNRFPWKDYENILIRNDKNVYIVTDAE